jgi:DNA-directed RNA polymerase subunit RPC12/RpoP
MKTLEEHNAERWRDHEVIGSLNDPRPNGIICPDCGNELWDTNPMITLTSYPAKKHTNCPECGYRGYRLA